MSKYIDIVRIIKDKKKFNIKIEASAMKSSPDGTEMDSALVMGECLVFNNGVLVHHNNNAIFINLFSWESREDKAKKFTNNLCRTPMMAHLLQHHVENVKVSIDNDVFWLNKREWRI